MELSDRTLIYYENLEGIINSVDKNNEEEKLKEMYKFLRDACPYYYHDNNIDLLYSFLLYEVEKCEKDITSYIVDVNAKKVNESIVANIVDIGRRYLHIIHSFNNDYVLDINDIYLGGDCSESSNNIAEICNKLDIKCHIIRIDPGYDVKLGLYNGDGYHYFNIIEMDNTYFLIDLKSHILLDVFLELI